MPIKRDHGIDQVALQDGGKMIADPMRKTELRAHHSPRVGVTPRALAALMLLATLIVPNAQAATRETSTKVFAKKAWRGLHRRRK